MDVNFSNGSRYEYVVWFTFQANPCTYILQILSSLCSSHCIVIRTIYEVVVNGDAVWPSFVNMLLDASIMRDTIKMFKDKNLPFNCRHYTVSTSISLQFCQPYNVITIVHIFQSFYFKAKFTDTSSKIARFHHISTNRGKWYNQLIWQCSVS